MTTWPNRLALLIWLILIGVGALLLAFFEPPEEKPSLERWPAASHLDRSARHACLVMFLHPGCACTQPATDAFCRVLKQLPAEASAFVVLENSPIQGAEDLLRADIAQGLGDFGRAIMIPDQSGAEARAFDATSSGEVRLYGADGLLRYRGLAQADGTGASAHDRALVKPVSMDAEHPELLLPAGCALFSESCPSRGGKH